MKKNGKSRIVLCLIAPFASLLLLMFMYLQICHAKSDMTFATECILDSISCVY